MTLAVTCREKEAKGKKQCDCIVQTISNSTYTHTWTHKGKQVGLRGPVPLKTRSTWKAGTFQSAQGKRHRHRRPITLIRETRTEHTVPCWITPSSLHSTLRWKQMPLLCDVKDVSLELEGHSVVKSAYRSCWGLEFGSQPPHPAAQSNL